ncbi:MAG: NADH-quinone oxidoreductase subunit NuoH [Elusimicrobia bacterium]|nr:NADH-quinone oxidoreductase subunit NuoH [Elusimicrobiota bacterium]
MSGAPEKKRSEDAKTPKSAEPAEPAPKAAEPAPKPAEPAAPAAPKPAAPKPPAKPPLPEPKLASGHGRLLTDRFATWPQPIFDSKWSRPSYKRGAMLLGGLLLGGALLGALIGELAPWADRLDAWLGAFGAARGWPAGTAEGIWIALKVLIVLHVVLINGLWAIWWERKISAHIQSRVGPTYAGGWHGWLQTALDGLKLFLKEDVTPAAADRRIHALAPAIAFVPCVVAFAPVLFGKELAAARLDIGALYVFAIAGVSVIGVVMAGWASGNKYSLLGGLRAAAQIVSYELPRGFSVVPVLMFAGSLDLAVIARAQAGYWWGFVPRWFVFYPVVGQVAFLIFLIASIAETNRVPFDIPEAESELVSGFHTEYSGMKWSIFFLTEYGYVPLASFLLATFFLGAGASPLNFAPFTLVPSWLWMLGKAMAMMFVFLWVRWTLPRFRVDQMMDFTWKFLLPWSFANIAAAGVFLALWVK